MELFDRVPLVEAQGLTVEQDWPEVSWDDLVDMADEEDGRILVDVGNDVAVYAGTWTLRARLPEGWTSPELAEEPIASEMEPQRRSEPKSVDDIPVDTILVGLLGAALPPSEDADAARARFHHVDAEVEAAPEPQAATIRTQP